MDIIQCESFNMHYLTKYGTYVNVTNTYKKISYIGKA